MQFGKVSLNVKALANISEGEFYKIIAGCIDYDKKEAWAQFSKEADQYKKKEPKEKV